MKTLWTACKVWFMKFLQHANSNVGSMSGLLAKVYKWLVLQFGEVVLNEENKKTTVQRKFQVSS